MCKLRKKNIDITKLRKTLGYYPTGVSIVTAPGVNGQPIGMTINSLISISLEPPLVGWCVDRRAASFADFSQCQNFSISILSEDQSELARLFATRGADKFAGLCAGRFDAGETQAGVLIPGACAWIRCSVYRFVPLGDHLMLVGEITHFQHADEVPLVFSKGIFRNLAGENKVAA